MKRVRGSPDVLDHLPLHGVTDPAPFLRFLDGGVPPPRSIVEPARERIHAVRLPWTTLQAFRRSTIR
jgi:hypothetical protein